MTELLITIALIVLVICLCIAAYSRGRADGIRWTQDVYAGKYDDEIIKMKTHDRNKNR